MAVESKIMKGGQAGPEAERELEQLRTERTRWQQLNRSVGERLDVTIGQLRKTLEA